MTQTHLALLSSSLIAGERHSYFRVFTLASVAGIFSLFPLLFTPAGRVINVYGQSALTPSIETIIKVVYSLLWSLVVLLPMSKLLYE